MIKVEKAREKILSHIKALPPRKVSLEGALGTFLAEDICSAIDIPMQDNSAMDGYALRTEDINDAPTRLNVIYDLPAGYMPQRGITRLETVRIMTGAPIPPGADAVVKREDTEELGNEVIIKKAPKKMENIRFKGEDLKKDSVVLERGSYIGPAQMGILASIRRFLVHVHQRPLVAILSTGDEILDMDQDISQGKVYASNSYTMIGMVLALGAEPLYLGIAQDNKEDLEKKLGQACRADLILTSGGVSMGDYDLVKEIMTQGSNSMEFWKVEMKPGKPLAFGMINHIPAIGLPGNPVSTMVSFYQFARPAILKMMGSLDIEPPRVRARLMQEIKKKTDRRHYVRGVLKMENQELCVYPSGPQGSGILSSMAKGNCFIVLPKQVAVATQGDMVACEIFQGI